MGMEKGPACYLRVLIMPYQAILLHLSSPRALKLHIPVPVALESETHSSRGESPVH